MNLLITHSHAHIYTLRRIETSNFKSMNISFSLHLIILQREAFTQVFQKTLEFALSMWTLSQRIKEFITQLVTLKSGDYPKN